jgi:hypothetical protein
MIAAPAENIKSARPRAPPENDKNRNICCQNQCFRVIKDRAEFAARAFPNPMKFTRGNPALDAVLTPTTNYEPKNLSAPGAVRDISAPISNLSEKDELIFELGLWLSGIESFLNLRNHSFIEESRSKAASRDWVREFRLTHSTLLFCSKLSFQLSKILQHEPGAKSLAAELDLIDDLDEVSGEFEISREEIYQLSLVLKDSILLNEGLMRAAPLRFGEWNAWCSTLAGKLKSLDIVGKLITRAEKAGENYLPEAFKDLLVGKPLPFALEADLRLVLPRFGKILKWLSVVERMLDSDAPLKPTLLIFSRIHEQIQEMTAYINNRLLRYPNEEDELFGQLDGAAYTASLELKKVYHYELAGLSEMRSTPSIYARIETAFSLLNDSFQLTLINFAQIIDPKIATHRIFPNLKTKLERSLILRQSLWSLLNSLKQAEQNPDKYPMSQLHGQLGDFLADSLSYLFYKDRETVERFIEEVLVTDNKKDLVPILHRFGAYIETLFGQVNMRVVLAGHPFDYQQK